MQAKNVEARDTLVAINCDAQVRLLRDLLDGEIISDGARAIPNKMVDAAKRVDIANELVKKIVASFLRQVRIYDGPLCGG